jgi:hypothetical protein
MREHEVLVVMPLVGGVLLGVLLMPPRAHDQEVRILAAIAGAAFDPAARERLLAAGTEKKLAALLGSRQSRASMRPSRASLADI